MFTSGWPMSLRMEGLCQKCAGILRIFVVLLAVSSSVPAQVTPAEGDQPKPPSITVIGNEPKEEKVESSVLQLSATPVNVAENSASLLYMESSVSFGPPENTLPTQEVPSIEFVVSLTPKEDVTLPTSEFSSYPDVSSLLPSSTMDVVLQSSMESLMRYQTSTPLPELSSSVVDNSPISKMMTTLVPGLGGDILSASLVEQYSSLPDDGGAMVTADIARVTSVVDEMQSSLVERSKFEEVIEATQTASDNAMVSNIPDYSSMFFIPGVEISTTMDITPQATLTAVVDNLNSLLASSLSSSSVYEAPVVSSTLTDAELDINVTEMAVMPTPSSPMVTSTVVMGTQSLDTILMSSISDLVMTDSMITSSLMSDLVPVSTLSVDLMSTTVLGINTTVPPSASTTTAMKQYTLKVKLTFSGNCSVLKGMKAQDNLAEFKSNLVKVLSQKLNFKSNLISMDNITCGSIIVIVSFNNVTDEDNLQASLESLPNDVEMFTASNNSYSFVLMKYETMEADPGDTDEDPFVNAKKTRKPLTQVQIIVIIVCSVVGGTLIFYALGFCVYACYQKKKTKSFDLGETPASNMDLEDFTLTKMQRPNLKYTDYGVVAANGKNKKYRKNGHYQPIDDDMQCVGPDDIHLADTLPRRSPGNVHVSPPEDQTVIPTTGDGAYDNRSFSSDDILDSGAEPTQESNSANSTPTHNGTTQPTTDTNKQGKEGATAF